MSATGVGDTRKLHDVFRITSRGLRDADNDSVSECEGGSCTVAVGDILLCVLVPLALGVLDGDGVARVDDGDGVGSVREGDAVRVPRDGVSLCELDGEGLVADSLPDSVGVPDTDGDLLPVASAESDADADVSTEPVRPLCVCVVLAVPDSDTELVVDVVPEAVTLVVAAVREKDSVKDDCAVNDGERLPSADQDSDTVVLAVPVASAVAVVDCVALAVCVVVRVSVCVLHLHPTTRLPFTVPWESQKFAAHAPGTHVGYPT